MPPPDELKQLRDDLRAEIAVIRSDVASHDELLRGNKQTGRGGALPLLDKTSEAVLGSEKVDGLLKDVYGLKRIQYIGFGIIVAIQCAPYVIQWAQWLTKIKP